MTDLSPLPAELPRGSYPAEKRAELQATREKGKKLIDEITLLDQRIAGLGKTPKRLRPARLELLTAERDAKVQEYHELKKYFQSLKASLQPMA